MLEFLGAHSQPCLTHLPSLTNTASGLACALITAICFLSPVLMQVSRGLLDVPPSGSRSLTLKLSPNGFSISPEIAPYPFCPHLRMASWSPGPLARAPGLSLDASLPCHSPPPAYLDPSLLPTAWPSPVCSLRPRSLPCPLPWAPGILFQTLQLTSS